LPKSRSSSSALDILRQVELDEIIEYNIGQSSASESVNKHLSLEEWDDMTVPDIVLTNDGVTAATSVGTAASPFLDSGYRKLCCISFTGD
jgi:hypothetical protein